MKMQFCCCGLRGLIRTASGQLRWLVSCLHCGSWETQVLFVLLFSPLEVCGSCKCNDPTLFTLFVTPRWSTRGFYSSFSTKRPEVWTSPYAKIRVMQSRMDSLASLRHSRILLFHAPLRLDFFSYLLRNVPWELWTETVFINKGIVSPASSQLRIYVILIQKAVTPQDWCSGMFHSQPFLINT